MITTARDRRRSFDAFWRGLLKERQTSARALAHERRRIAADVHDLVMQDLAFALAHARTLTDDEVNGDQATTVVLAGERALAGARQIVAGLTRRESHPIVEVLETSVRVAARGTRLVFDAEQAPASPQPDQPTREALLHIAREAVTNAVKHSQPEVVEVTLARTDEWCLTVRDRGMGFNAQEQSSAGFGLASMRQHADALGGRLHLSSEAGTGTTVEALLP
jgi:signal transduction histidine kinase